MKNNNLQLFTFYLLFLMIATLGIITSLITTKNLVPIIFQGKSLEARSELIQFGFYFTFSVLFAIIFFIIGFFLWKQRSIKNTIIESVSKYLSKILISSEKNYKNSGINIFLIIGVSLIAISVIYVQLKLIIFPYPLELREGSILLSTHALMKGINPYSLGNNPIYINGFGVLYNLVILPFSLSFGNTLQLHRLINAFFIIGQLILITLVLRKKKIGWISVGIAILFMWIGQLFMAGPTTRPDTFGELLFLLSLFIPLLCNFSNFSLFFSSVVAVMAFHTKAYFFLGAIILAIYLFLFISKRKSIFYGLWVGFLFLTTLFVINNYLETYLLNNIFPLFTGRITSNYAHLIKQCIRFFQDYWGLLLISLGFSIFYVYKRKFEKPLPIMFDLFNLEKAFFSSRLDFVFFCLLITLTAVIFLFGKHSGTFQTYFYHLLTPFFVMICLTQIDKLRRFKSFLLIIALFTLISHSFMNLNPDFSNFDDPDWSRLKQYVSQSHEILNSPLDLPFLIEQNKPIAMSGFTQYFFLYPKSPSFLFSDPTEIEVEGQKYISVISQKIKNQEYDLLETFQNQGYELFLIGERLNYPQSDLAFIKEYYEQVDSLTITMPHTFESWDIGIWVPVD